MAAPEEIARVHQQRQRGIILSLIAAIIGLWRRLDEDRLTESWQAGVGPSIVETVARAQLSAAAAVPGYLRDLAEAQDIVMPALEVVPEAFSGVASDGRPLESLMYQPIIALKRMLADGVDPNEAMRRATAGVTMIAATQAADAGRGAVEAGMTANKQWTKYIRVVDLPACSRCIILAGQVYSFSTGFQRHPNCFPAGTIVSGPGNRAATRRWYEGELVVLRTASGQEMSVTGNHPILTDRGWVPANVLQPGDHVVRSVLGEGAVPLVVPDERQMPSRIEDLWAAFGPEVESVTRVRSTDFHGDGLEGSYARVRSSSSCSAYGKSGRSTTCAHRPCSWECDDLETSRHRGLAPGTVGSVLGLAATQPASRWAPTRRHTTGLASGDWAPGTSLGCFDTSSLGSLSRVLAALLDVLVPARLSGRGDAPGIRAGVPGAARLSFGGSPRHLTRDELSHSMHRRVRGADISLDAYCIGSTYPHITTAVGVNGGIRWDATDGPEDARIGRDLLKSLGSQVELDQVVGVTRKQWRGYVYNLTSSEGWYVANGLVVSNCDCTMQPVGPEAGVDSIASPMALFEQMTAEEQDRRFGKAGAEAIRLGADMGQVVNARRGMQTAGGRLVTSEGTSKRGFAASKMRRGQVRLMPETIIAEAGGDRDAAIQGLRENGFLLGPSTPRRRESAPAMESSAAPIAAPEPDPEVAPVPRWHRTLDGIEDLAAAVEDPRPLISRQKLTGGESAVTELLTLADGTRVVRKSGVTADVPDALDAEQASSLIARALGLRAPRVYRNAPDSIWMEYVDDAITAEELRETDPAEWDARNRAALDLDDGSLVGLLDVLISNQDRNTGNWMLAADGRTIPIDHGHAFTVLADDFETYLPVPDRVDAVTGFGPFADSFMSGSNPLTRSDVPEARRRLERLRPEFEHMNRAGWLDYSLQVLDKIEPEASGFGSVFPEEESL